MFLKYVPTPGSNCFLGQPGPALCRSLHHKGRRLMASFQAPRATQIGFLDCLGEANGSSSRMGCCGPRKFKAWMSHDVIRIGDLPSSKPTVGELENHHFSTKQSTVSKKWTMPSMAMLAYWRLQDIFPNDNSCWLSFEIGAPFGKTSFYVTVFPMRYE